MGENISNLSQIENNFDEKDAKIKAGDYYDEDELKSSFDSEASRINFWKDINIKEP